MSREVKRVAMDFSWPLNKVWDGFCNPHYRRCVHCDGRGSTKSSRAFEKIVRLLCLGAKESVARPANYGGVPTLIPSYPGSPHKMHYPHPYLVEIDINDPGDTLHEIVSGMVGKPVDGSLMGSDHVWEMQKAMIKAAGLQEKWGWCLHCDGDGMDPSCKEAYEAWEQTDPPAGEGWQMWETTSEGSPISAVCDSPESLAAWLVENEASAFGSTTATYDQWLNMIRGPGWAPSAVGGPGGLSSGVKFVGTERA